MKTLDYQYSLQPDWHIPALLDESGMLSFDKTLLPETTQVTVLLEISYTSTSKKRMGVVELRQSGWQPEARENEQFFEPQQAGKRYLNLTRLPSLHEVQCITHDCKLASQVSLLLFRNPPIERGPMLIIAPHADDAELAAYGVYQHLHSQVWIATLYAGESLQKIAKQYIPDLDSSMDEGCPRKASIRHWNSMTTPLLANVPANQLVCLGYSGITVETLYHAPQEPIMHGAGQKYSPVSFRALNSLSLSNDLDAANTPQAMVNELCELLLRVQPTTVLVTDPEVDPHPEHKAAAHALALAMEQSDYVPQQVLMYVNHLNGIKDFPYGPEHTTTALAPFYKNHEYFNQVQVYSYSLSLAEQKEKVVAFDTMHDLRASASVEKQIKRWWHEKRYGYGYRYYGHHIYFQTHIKAAEVFTVLPGRHYCEQLLAACSK
ncbi:MAG: PIG-L family deacetylase [Vibrio sp.]